MRYLYCDGLSISGGMGADKILKPTTVKAKEIKGEMGKLAVKFAPNGVFKNSFGHLERTDKADSGNYSLVKINPLVVDGRTTEMTFKVKGGDRKQIEADITKKINESLKNKDDLFGNPKKVSFHWNKDGTVTVLVQPASHWGGEGSDPWEQHFPTPADFKNAIGDDLNSL